MFVIALRAVRRLPSAEFTPYGLTEADGLALIERTTEWADALERTS